VRHCVYTGRAKLRRREGKAGRLAYEEGKAGRFTYEEQCSYADTPIRRYADTPIRRYADTPIRRHPDTPTPRHADTFPYAVPSRSQNFSLLS
jgi:hypothetical protein